MKRSFRGFAMASSVVAVGALVGCASSSDYDTTNMAARSAQAQPAGLAGADVRGLSKADYAAHARDISATNIIGQDVWNLQDEKLGKVVDLVVDPRYERVHYAVLQFDAAGGMGDRYFAYPLSSFHVSPDRNTFVLHLDKEALQRAPAFERIEWPKATAERLGEYLVIVDRVYDPGRTIITDTNLVRATDLLGKNIDDKAGASAGKIRDLVIDSGTGHVRYVVADFSQPFTARDTSLPLPLETLSFSPVDTADAVLNVDPQRLNTLQGYDPNRWPDLNDPAYRQQVDRQLDTLSNAVPGTTR